MLKKLQTLSLITMLFTLVFIAIPSDYAEAATGVPDHGTWDSIDSDALADSVLSDDVL